MAADYRKFSNKQFVYEVNGIMVKNKLFFKRNKEDKDSWKAEDVTHQIPNTWEHVYSVPTKKPWIDLLIYSSVSLADHHTRDIGADAVRVVQRWRGFNGEMGYRAVHFNPNSVTKRHNRVETLFQNLEKTLVMHMTQVDNLRKEQFVWEKLDLNKLFGQGGE